MTLKAWFTRLFSPKIVFAHCDIPCGIYDPHGAQISVLTVLRMMDLMGGSQDTHDIVRYTTVKEQHAEMCKNEVRVIYGDYFKDEHLDKYPELHVLNHEIMTLASTARQGKDRKIAEELLDKVNRMAEIFWETKGMKFKRVEAPYSVSDQIVVPEL